MLVCRGRRLSHCVFCAVQFYPNPHLLSTSVGIRGPLVRLIVLLIHLDLRHYFLIRVTAHTTLNGALYLTANSHIAFAAFFGLATCVPSLFHINSFASQGSYWGMSPENWMVRPTQSLCNVKGQTGGSLSHCEQQLIVLEMYS